jgi:predicted Fe-Mo cluster-binding NifX family protein
MEEKNSAMKVAVTVWEDRVSPVFDSARNLLIAEIENAQVINTHYQQFDPDQVSQFAEMLKAHEVDAIICGAISEGPANLLEAAGFELISFIAGNVIQVIENFVKENPVWTELIMPGCGRTICCRGKIRKPLDLQDINRKEIAVKGRGIRMSARTENCQPNSEVGQSVVTAEVPTELSVENLPMGKRTSR